MGNSNKPAKSQQRWNLPFLGALTVCLVFQITACGLKTRTQSLLGKKVNLEIVIKAEANGNNPVAMDYVLVYDKKLLDELIKLPAKEWFLKKDQYMRDYPNNEAFSFWGWEWVPGQAVKVKHIPLLAKAQGGLIFVNYFIKGDHRARVNPHKNVKITFLEKSFIVEPK